MSTIQTVTGPVSPDELGVVLLHEHVYSGGEPALYADRDDHSEFPYWDLPITIDILGALRRGAPNRENMSLNDEGICAEELGHFAAYGGRTVVDNTGVGLSRDPVALRRIAEVTGLNIITTTGFYKQAMHPEWVGEMDADQVADLMVEEIGKITDQPITHVVVASDHGDHTAGNGAFPEGVEYIVHENSVAPMERMHERIPEIPIPETVISDRMDLTLGGRTVEILFLGRAHTGGDLVVHLPEESVLFLSETYLHRVYPAMRSAYPTEWLAMLRRAQEIDARVNIPGHGFVDSPEVLRDELQVAIDALGTVIAESTRLHGMGLTPEEADEQADFGDLETWSLRESQRGMALRRVYMELNGELP